MFFAGSVSPRNSNGLHQVGASNMGWVGKQAITSKKMKTSGKNDFLQQCKVIQGHRSWCQSKAYMQLPISH